MITRNTVAKGRNLACLWKQNFPKLSYEQDNQNIPNCNRLFFLENKNELTKHSGNKVGRNQEKHNLTEERLIFQCLLFISNIIYYQ